MTLNRFFLRMQKHPLFAVPALDTARYRLEPDRIRIAGTTAKAAPGHSPLLYTRRIGYVVRDCTTRARVTADDDPVICPRHH